MDANLETRIKACAARWYVRSLRVTLKAILPEPGIIALWHQDLAMAMKAFSGRGIRVLLSTSRDGEVAARCASGLGYRVSRGSSSRRGSAGLRDLIRDHRKSPNCVGMALDGPKGPRYQIKPGTLWLGQTLKMPIYPLGVAVKGAIQLEQSWDKARLPLPFFGTACAVVGEPLWNPQIDELDLAMKKMRLAAESLLFPGRSSHSGTESKVSQLPS